MAEIANVRTQSPWVLIDASDVIVHLFRPEVRSFYNLEKLWGAAPPPSPSGASLGASPGAATSQAFDPQADR